MDENKEPENDMIKNIEQIQSFSKLLGQSENGFNFNPQDLAGMMEMAGKVSKFMAMLKEEDSVDTSIEAQSTEPLFSPSRQINMLNAAIPFLDKEYQKNIFIATKLLELKRMSSMDIISIQSKDDLPQQQKSERKSALLKVLRPYLSEGERKNLDTMMKMVKIRKLMGTMNKEEL